jgi:hypothetical protein
MADTDAPRTDLAEHDDGDAPDLSRDDHLLMAKAHHEAAQDHLESAGDHLDALREDGGDDAGRAMMSASAQQRAFGFPAGSGAARSLRQATAGRRG